MVVLIQYKHMCIGLQMVSADARGSCMSARVWHDLVRSLKSGLAVACRDAVMPNLEKTAKSSGMAFS